MYSWLIVAIPAATIALFYVAPASALELFVGGNANAQSSSSAEGSSSTFGFGAQAGVYAGPQGGGEGAGTWTANADSSGSLATTLIAASDVAARVELVIRLLESSDWNADSFVGLSSAEDSSAFNVDGWLTSETAAEFDAALESNWGEVQELRAAIEASAVFHAWLESSQIHAENVVAVGQTADGSLAVFTSGS